jgi:hypothetical protein
MVIISNGSYAAPMRARAHAGGVISACVPQGLSEQTQNRGLTLAPSAPPKAATRRCGRRRKRGHGWKQRVCGRGRKRHTAGSGASAGASGHAGTAGKRRRGRHQWRRRQRGTRWRSRRIWWRQRHGRRQRGSGGRQRRGWLCWQRWRCKLCGSRFTRRLVRGRELGLLRRLLQRFWGHACQRADCLCFATERNVRH